MSSYFKNHHGVGAAMAVAAMTLLSAIFSPTASADPGPAVKPGDLLAIVGDSITEQKQYSCLIEEYLIACKPVANVRVMQFGWGGDTAAGFLRDKLANDVLRFKPNVMTTCFGMNDGAYQPPNPGIAKNYETATQGVIDAAKAGNIRTIVLGTPGCVDSVTFRNGAEAAKGYNQTLTNLSKIDQELASKNGLYFADVNTAMMQVMPRIKAKYGEKFPFAGGDGVHPPPAGHIVMAYAFLKAMELDDNIGTITLDLTSNTATATQGHKVLSDKIVNGSVQIESSRYPFCFNGPAGDPNLNLTSVEFIPFNQELNRFNLVVLHPPAGAANFKVTFGQASKVFSAQDLATGVNLAAEFPQNPFSEPFQRVHNAVQAQQNFETVVVKSVIYNIPTLNSFVSEENKAALPRIVEDFRKKDQALFDAAVAEVKPVTYTITVENAE